MDQVRDKMIGNEAALGVIYSGEALYCHTGKSGSGICDSKRRFQPLDRLLGHSEKCAKHKENAEAFINYLCQPEIAKMNFDYITYSIPNSAGQALIEEPEYRESQIAFPDIDTLTNCETFHYLGPKNDAIYNKLWREVKSK